MPGSCEDGVEAARRPCEAPCARGANAEHPHVTFTIASLLGTNFAGMRINEPNLHARHARHARQVAPAAVPNGANEREVA
jgi:hypothetical protein